MIRKTILFGLLCLTASMATSCNDSESEVNDEDLLIIEPPYEAMFKFNEQGIPYRLNSPTLSPEMQRNLREEVIGHGWKWMQTFEILDDGFVDPEDYYQSRDGVSPSSYYFKSEKEMVRYFFSIPVGERVYLEQGCTLDLATGTLSHGNNPTGIIPWSLYLRIWSAYYLVDGRWYMSTIEPLGLRPDKNGEFSKIVWGYSHYYRMSEAELNQMQKDYSFDYSQVN